MSEQRSLNCPAAAVSVQTADKETYRCRTRRGRVGYARRLRLLFCRFSISARQLWLLDLHATSDHLAIVVHLSRTFQRDLVLRHLAALPNGRSLRVRIRPCFRRSVRDLRYNGRMNAADGIDHLRSPEVWNRQPAAEL